MYSDTFMARFTVSREVTGDAREGFPSCGLYMPGDNRVHHGFPWNRAAGTGVPCDVCNNRPGRPGHGSIGCILLPAPGEAGITQHNHTQPGPGFPDDIRPGILSPDRRVFQGDGHPVLFPGFAGQCVIQRVFSHMDRS